MYTNDFRIPYELEGKTIETCEMIQAEPFATANRYVLVVFKDGTRHIFAVNAFCFNKPDPSAANMARAQFFSPAEVAEKEQRDQARATHNKKYQREADMRIYLALKASLGIED